MIYGNRVGGVTPEKTYIITNEDETVKFSAVAIELNDEKAKTLPQVKDLLEMVEFVMEQIPVQDAVI